MEKFSAVFLQVEYREMRKQFSKIGQTEVIYCIDTDRIDIDPARKKEFEEIASYCDEINAGLVWLSRDIEDVYWGNQIDKSKKTQMASKFKSSKRINTIKKEYLEVSTISRHKSNILSILNDLLLDYSM